MYLFVMSIRCQKMLVRDVYETEVTLYGRHSDRTYVNDVPSLPFPLRFAGILPQEIIFWLTAMGWPTQSVQVAIHVSA